MIEEGQPKVQDNEFKLRFPLMYRYVLFEFISPSL